MNSISCYEVAYKMQQQNISVEVIAATLGKSRATFYRWLQSIRRNGIRSLLKRIYERWHMGLSNMMTPAEFKDFYNKDPERAKLELATLPAKRYGKRKILICG